MSDYDGRTDAGTFYVRIASMQLWPDVIDVSPMWDRGGPVEHRRYVPERGECHIAVHDNLAETEGMGDVWLECDECRWQMPLESITPRFNFCPNCGRRVKEEA